MTFAFSEKEHYINTSNGYSHLNVLQLTLLVAFEMSVFVYIYICVSFPTFSFFPSFCMHRTFHLLFFLAQKLYGLTNMFTLFFLRLTG